MNGTMKKIIGGFLLVLLAVAAWGYFVYLPKWTAEQEEKFREALASLPEDIRPAIVEFSKFSPGLFDQSLTIENLQVATNPGAQESIDFFAKKVHIGGVNPLAFTQAGTHKLFGSLVLEDAVVTMRSGEFYEGTIKYGLLRLEEPQADMVLVNKTFSADAQEVQEILTALQTVSIKSLYSENQQIAVNAGFYSQGSEVKKVSLKGLSLGGIEYGKYEGISTSLNGQNVLEAAEAGLEKLTLPAPHILFGISPEGDVFSMPQALAKNPLVLDNIYIRDMQVHIPGLTPTSGITLKELVSSLRLAGRDGKVKLHVESLAFSSDVADLLPLSLNPFIAGQALNISKDLDVDWIIDAEDITTVNVHKLAFSEPTLGSADVKAKLLLTKAFWASFLMAEDIGWAKVASLSVALDDKQLVNSIVAMTSGPMVLLAPHPVQRKLAVVAERESLAANIAAAGEQSGLPEGSMELVKDSQALLRNGGAMTLDYAPAEPMELQDMNLSNLQGIKTTYTAPGTPPFPSAAVLLEELNKLPRESTFPGEAELEIGREPLPEE